VPDGKCPAGDPASSEDAVSVVEDGGLAGGNGAEWFKGPDHGFTLRSCRDFCGFS
jgi:hypothetical protein